MSDLSLTLRMKNGKHFWMGDSCTYRVDAPKIGHSSCIYRDHSNGGYLRVAIHTTHPTRFWTATQEMNKEYMLHFDNYQNGLALINGYSLSMIKVDANTFVRHIGHFKVIYSKWSNNRHFYLTIESPSKEGMEYLLKHCWHMTHNNSLLELHITSEILSGFKQN